jgi:hypothetical protein
MNIMISRVYSNLWNKKKVRRVKKKNVVHINYELALDLDTLDGIRWLVPGNAGSGKTWLMGIVLDQFPNSQMIDPTGKFINTLEKQGTYLRWQVFQLAKKRTSKPLLKMNTNDLHIRCLNTIFPKTNSTPKQQMQSQIFEEFLQRKEKTYAELKELCKQHQLMHILNDLDYILHPHDNAPSIRELIYGKKVIDVEGISINQRCVGVYLQSILGFKSDMGENWSQKPENFTMLGFDEAQAYCRYNTPLGNTNADIIGQARKYGLGSLTGGAGYNTIHIDIRTKWNKIFVFNSPGLTKHYTREGINIISDDWERMGKYECAIYSDDGNFKGFEGEHLFLPDLTFLDVRHGKKVEKVSSDKTNYNFSKFKRFT